MAISHRSVFVSRRILVAAFECANVENATLHSTTRKHLKNQQVQKGQSQSETPTFFKSRLSEDPIEHVEFGNPTPPHTSPHLNNLKNLHFELHEAHEAHEPHAPHEP